MKTVGFYGGKFLPLHMGHVYMITKAACMVDELYVILSYSRKRDEMLCRRENFKIIPPEIRIRWLGQLTKDMENVKVIGIEDFCENDDEYDWEDGANKIKAAIGKPIDYIFSSENTYDDIFKKLYPTAKHIIIDEERKTFNISATRIRKEGVFKNWDYIPDVVKPYFNKKVVIVGTESCGKSTLTRYLAKLFNTNYVSEYGRELYEEYGGVEGGFTPDMYDYIVYGAKAEELKAVKRANKVLFIDTEAIVTSYYLKLYTNNESKIIDEVIKKQNYDLWLFLEPDVKWINDGTRLHGEEEIRNKNNKMLKNILERNNVKYEVITGTYEERLIKSMEFVNKLFV